MVPHHKYVHIVEEGSTYFIKFDFRSKVSDYKKASSVIKNPVIQLMRYDTVELYDDFFHYPILDNYKFTRSVEDDVVSNYIIFELSNFDKNIEIDTILLNIPFSLFDCGCVYPLKNISKPTLSLIIGVSMVTEEVHILYLVVQFHYANNTVN